MEFREDPLESLIEEIATLLATGYLRLRKARILTESAASPVPQQPENDLTAQKQPTLMACDAKPREEGG